MTICAMFARGFPYYMIAYIFFMLFFLFVSVHWFRLVRLCAWHVLETFFVFTQQQCRQPFRALCIWFRCTNVCEVRIYRVVCMYGFMWSYVCVASMWVSVGISYFIRFSAYVYRYSDKNNYAELNGRRRIEVGSDRDVIIHTHTFGSRLLRDTYNHFNCTYTFSHDYTWSKYNYIVYTQTYAHIHAIVVCLVCTKRQ